MDEFGVVSCRPEHDGHVQRQKSARYTGSVCNEADGSSWGDGGGGGISHKRSLGIIENASFIVGKFPRLFASSADTLGFFLNKFHDGLGFQNGLIRIIGYPHFNQHIGKPMIPSPILRLSLLIFSIWGRGYLLISMTLSRK